MHADANVEPAPIAPGAGRTFVVAAGHELAAEAGARVYERTGNAADAAVAATVALGVLEPHRFGLGGEVTGLVHMRGRSRVLAGSTVAPEAMTLDAFRRLGLDLIPDEGLLPAGPPAVLHALVVLLRDLGSTTFSVAAEPAIALAADGFPIDGTLARAIGEREDRFRGSWPETAAVWMPDGRPPRPGTVIRQPALAETLLRLGGAGGHEPVLHELRAGFVAEAILRFASEPHAAPAGTHRSLLETEDLASFAVGWEPPLAWTDERGRTILKAGPWTQGPALLQHLAIMRAGGWTDRSPLSDDLLHALVESFKLAMADREGYYGDERFIDVPLAELLSPGYATRRARLVGDAASNPEPGRPRPDLPPWIGATGSSPGHVGDTTHVDVADRSGDLIALTPSGGWFDAPVIPELGFPLGTRCQTFWLDPLHPNVVAPGKRPRTTLSPTLVMRGDRAEFALGTPGGDAQDQVQGQMLHALHHGWPVEEVVDMPLVVSTHAPSSFYPHGSTTMGVDVESRLGTEVIRSLADRGHRVEVLGPWHQEVRPQVIGVGADGLMRASVSRRFGTGGVVAT